MYKTGLKISCFVLVAIWLVTGCQRELTPISITLYDKPLPEIQDYIRGKWKLNYYYSNVYGIFQDHYDSYMIISDDHLTIGNAHEGNYIDTAIIWIRTIDIFNDSTYLMSYPVNYYPYIEYYVMDQIKSDTLVIFHNVPEGLHYLYSKN